MSNYYVTMYRRVKRMDDIGETRRQWKAGKLFVRKRNNFARYTGGDFDDLITLFAKEKLYTRTHIESNQPLMVIEAAI